MGEQQSTRGRILALLCRAGATAGDLAERLGISASATRVHLQSMEREGLVRYRVERRGVGKPTHVYELSGEGERLLSRAYIPVLDQLLAVLEGEEGFEEDLRNVGRALAGGVQGGGPAGSGEGEAREDRERGRVTEDPESSIERAVSELGQLGGVASAERRGSGWVIRGECCPLGAVATHHPSVCKLVESFLEELTGRAVRETCNRSGRPHCQFELAGWLKSPPPPA